MMRKQLFKTTSLLLIYYILYYILIISCCLVSQRVLNYKQAGALYNHINIG